MQDYLRAFLFGPDCGEACTCWMKGFGTALALCLVLILIFR